MLNIINSSSCLSEFIQGSLLLAVVMGIFFTADFADKYLEYWPENDGKPSRLNVILLLYLFWYTPLVVLFYAAICGSSFSIMVAIIGIPMWLIASGYWFYKKFTQR